MSGEPKSDPIEASLRISDARFRGLWDAGIILITITDAAGTIIDVNGGFSRVVGYSREELVAQRIRWPDITPSEWLPADDEAIAQLRSTGIATAWEKELIAKDGRRVAILAGAVMIDQEVISIAIDLTERKRVENDLYERTKIAALSADVGAAVTHGDTLGHMLQQCSEAIVNNLGAALARIWTLDPGQDTLELAASAGVNTRLDGMYARVAIGGFDIGLIAQTREPHTTNDVCHDPRVADPEWVRREGMVAFAGYPLIVRGELVGVVAMFAHEAMPEAAFAGLRAISDSIAVGIQHKRAESTREQLEAQLRQAQKLEAIGGLAAGVAHDFNNILTVIISYSEIITGELAPDSPLRVDVEEITAAALRAAALTRRLLAFGRKQILQPCVLNLNDVIRDLKSMLRRLVCEDVKLVITSDPTIGNVNADPGQIEQVLMNLVVNAGDAMPIGGTLTVVTKQVNLDEAFAAQHVGVTTGPHVMLSVTDTGVGMTAAVRARIFEPFFTTKDQGKGTGLGLSTVFGIVRQSEGTIWVESELGVGTTFKAYFPMIDASVAPTVARESTGKGGSETILLCEDDEPVRTIIRTILMKKGYRVLEAQNGGEALLLCEQYAAPIDLLLTDVVMPIMSGRQLADRLHAIRPNIRVLYMSGYTDNAVVRYGILKAEIAYLQKPITPELLGHKVRAVLDAP